MRVFFPRPCTCVPTVLLELVGDDDVVVEIVLIVLVVVDIIES